MPRAQSRIATLRHPDAVSRARRSLALATCCVLALTAACTSTRPKIEPPQITLETVRITDIADAKANVTLGLRLANRNDFDLAIQAIEFEVTLDARPAASGRTSRIDALPAGGEGRLDVSGRVDVAAVTTALMTLGSQLPVAYTVSGTVTLTNGAALPFSRKGEIPVSRFDRALGARP